MGIKGTVNTEFGETRELYIRLNNVEANNHGAGSYALFRGFLSKESFESGGKYMWEQRVSFHPDVSLPIWEQAYDHLKTMDEITNPVDY